MKLESVRTSGTFSLDELDVEVEDNVCVVGDEGEVLVIDAANDHHPAVAPVAGRATVAIIDPWSR